MLRISLFLIVAAIFASCGNQPESQTETKPEQEAAKPAVVTELSAKDQAKYTQKGKAVAQATFMAMSSKLSLALAEGGVPNAIEYCNTIAIPLADSLSTVHKAKIRRTTTKARNMQDKPTDAEFAVLQDFHKKKAAGEAMKPFVENTASGIQFYAPIVMQDLCLKCHGKIGEDVSQEDYTLIKKYYPQDEAMDYSAGDLRGMWSINFEK